MHLESRSLLRSLRPVSSSGMRFQIHWSPASSFFLAVCHVIIGRKKERKPIITRMTNRLDNELSCHSNLGSRDLTAVITQESFAAVFVTLRREWMWGCRYSLAPRGCSWQKTGFPLRWCRLLLDSLVTSRILSSILIILVELHLGTDREKETDVTWRAICSRVL